MTKSTIFFASLSLLLAGALVFTLIQAKTRPGRTEDAAQAESATDVPLSVPRSASAEEGPTFAARSVAVYDPDRDALVLEQNGFERLPVASITKLMTAMVAIDFGVTWNQTADVDPNEAGPGGNLLLFSGETVTMRDLFHASLLGSANNATRAYVRQLGVDERTFVEAMNRKAVELGLEQTHFVEVTGLDPSNVSTAYEVARMAAYAFSYYPAIAEATSQPGYDVTFGVSGREHTIRNTNKLITETGRQYTGSKTGFLYEAGYCLVVEGKAGERRRVAVALGSPSEPEHFAVIDKLMQLPAL